ncbi:hypothetical protein B1778_04325 [Dehalococcoides mccartyi]|nr:hypothetical protein btf_891 [Dehalococcoides mccartyi BTF08]AQU05961.1 hypothetical protein B1777_04510 [Dehalococcoides mccartyi]AQU07406.1 hypothetical protein B1778_04325 [Dehalococcoides mccartyi]AQW62509.1 hypothetical protein B1779_04330 [Dehalococcoides mccartyi]
MDTQAALISKVYETLTEDSQLATIMDTIRVHPITAPADTPKPYIVHELSLRETDKPFPFCTGGLTIHLWDTGSNITRILSMRSRIIALFDQLLYNDEDISGARFNLQADNFVTDEPGIYHYVILFDIRLFKASEAESILEREGFMG